MLKWFSAEEGEPGSAVSIPSYLIIYILVASYFHIRLKWFVLELSSLKILKCQQNVEFVELFHTLFLITAIPPLKFSLEERTIDLSQY